MAVTTTTYLRIDDQSHFLYNGLDIYFTCSLHHILCINTNISLFNQLNPSIFNDYIADYPTILSAPSSDNMLPSQTHVQCYVHYVTSCTLCKNDVSMTYTTTTTTAGTAHFGP